MHRAERTAGDGEVLAERSDRAAVHQARAGDDAVRGNLLAGHAEKGAGVFGMHRELLKGVLHKERGEALAGRHQALLVARCDLVETAALKHFFAALVEFVEEMLFDGHGWKGWVEGFAAVTPWVRRTRLTRRG